MTHEKDNKGRILLRKWLKDTGTTVSALSYAIQVSPALIYGYLSGRTRPGLEHAARLETATGVDLRAWLETAEETADGDVVG